MSADDRRRTPDAEHPEEYWPSQAGLVSWIHRPREARAAAEPRAWFPDGVLNTCYNALDRHVVAGHADRVALVHVDPETGARLSLTYAELLERVAAFAGALRTLGVDKGDAVLVVLPPVPELVVAMLACARLGAVHCVTSRDLDPLELAARVDDVRPRVVVSASGGTGSGARGDLKGLIDESLGLAAHVPEVCVVKQRPGAGVDLLEPRDVDWDVVLRAGATAPAECVAVAATDPAYLLHVSGGPGHAEGVAVAAGGHAVAMAWVLPHLYGVHADQTWWAAVDPDSPAGQSLGVYAPLLCGATTVLVEGLSADAPDPEAFRAVLADARVEGLLTTVPALRLLGDAVPAGALGGSLRTLVVAGEGLDPGTAAWAESLGVEVHHWSSAPEGWPGPA